MEDIGTFFGHLEYIMAIWYRLWPFGIVCLHPPVLVNYIYAVPRKIWQSCLQVREHSFAL
jgi:hypothetical protein